MDSPATAKALGLIFLLEQPPKKPEKRVLGPAVRHPSHAYHRAHPLAARSLVRRQAGPILKGADLGADVVVARTRPHNVLAPVRILGFRV